MPKAMQHPGKHVASNTSEIQCSVFVLTSDKKAALSGRAHTQQKTWRQPPEATLKTQKTAHLQSK